MKHKKEVQQGISKYLEQFANESETVQPIIEFVNAFDSADLYSRKNFTGHITASAFIYNPASQSFLLIHHSTLNRWLQPGGHVEETDASLQDAALREAVEETGLPAETFISSNQIFDIDSHPIPANEKKNEPAHVHHDVRFLFTCEKHTTEIQQEHVSGCEWLHIDNLPVQPGFQRVKMKVKDFLKQHV